MTLMVNRSDRRFQTLSPTRAREAARLIENEARGNPSRPGASSDARQAGRIYDCNRVPHRVCTSTLARGRGPYMVGGEGGIRTAGSGLPALSNRDRSEIRWLVPASSRRPAIRTRLGSFERAPLELQQPLLILRLHGKDE